MNGLLRPAFAALLAALSFSAASASTVPSGVYFGLIGDSEGSGAVRVVLNRSGSGSGLVQIGSASPQALIIGETSGIGVLTLSRVSGSGLTVQLTLGQGSDSVPVISGAIQAGTRTLPVTLTHVAPAVTAKQSAGSYTFTFQNAAASALVDQPLAGVASARVSEQGNVRLIGALADGSALSSSGTLSEAGNFEFFQQTRMRRAQVSGTVDFATSTSTPAGTAQWASGTQTVGLSLRGARYVPGDKFAVAGPFRLLVKGIGASPLVVDQIPMLSRVDWRLQKSGDTPVAAGLVVPTGLVLGRYVTTNGGVRQVHGLLGVVTQSASSVVGMVLDDAAVSGEFQFTPSSAGAIDDPSLDYVTVLVNSSSVVVGNITSGGTLRLVNPIPSVSLNGATALQSVFTSAQYSIAPTLTGGTTLVNGGTLLVGSGALTVNAGLVKVGNGALTLTNSTVITGVLTPGSGSLVLGSGSVSVNAGSLVLNSAATVTLVNATNTFAVDADGFVLSAAHFSASSLLAINSIVPLAGHSIALPAGARLIIGNIPAGWTVTLDGVPISTGPQVAAGVDGGPSVLHVEAPAVTGGP